METEFTYDELRELSYLVWNKKTELRAAADCYAGYGGVFEESTQRAEQELESFKVLESKLEKMILMSLKTV
ncbi:hypothetical protein LEP1GSC115_0890 [Leptospira interrogans serovar Australis str. 200703203]|uniref:Uncharacterized protein n=1 Tax=Leptospira interrogans serovar Australis str. 200703203 TaxID=1085541 RepID=N1UBH1_LEPIR|nr:hypothetical protein LEP1GSC115_0890 [Leptospira interrogans serovar Australis str. 200703203]